MRRRLVVLLSVVAMFMTSFTTVGASNDDGIDLPIASDVASVKTDDAKTDRYVVVMRADPLVATYGREAVDSSAARAEGRRLVQEQDEALEDVGLDAGDKVYSYTTSLNGFAAALTDSEVAKMSTNSAVAVVLRDVMRYPTTDASPSFLGLTGGRGVWSTGLTGEDVIVGVIDTGIWPEHPSFADDGSYSDLGVSVPCEFGNTAANADDAPFTCNHKLLGARQMLATYRDVIGTEPDEFDSARDDDGHGTHTASTAAGNADVDAEIFSIDRGEISGIAHRARVIAYKSLGNQGGFSSDLAAAIDQAVADGVDVINYSVGGGASLSAADDIAFLFAADAGVFVATSAGNSGPGDATIGGPASVPWITSVGANTQPRFFQGTVRLGNGGRYTGASITESLGSHRLVDAEFAGGDLCVPGTLDPTVVEGNIVLCRRGAIGRAAKSLAVVQAGGVGMIMYNNEDVDTLYTDNHWVPSVQTDYTPGIAIKGYIASARRPTARIIGEQETTWRPAPNTAYFSSRGPNPAAEDIVKPDVTAPGVQILAGNSPFPDPGSTPPGELFQAIAGTSMSSPHVAGMFALIAQAQPDWSAAMAKSALMTTAYQSVNDYDRASQATPFAMGSGHIDPSGRSDKGTPFSPGLVYDAGFLDYLGFLCDADRSVFADAAATCGSLEGLGVPTEATDLNYPSIGVSSLPGTITVTRTVTSVQSESGTMTYTANVKAPKGYQVTVSPRRLRLQPGESATFEVTITNKNAPIGEWRFGSLTWKSSRYDVYSPIAVKAALFDAPGEVTGTGEDGSASFPIQFGYTGSYTAGAHGLVSATVTDDTVPQDPDQTFDPTDGFSDAVPIDVTDAAWLRIALPPDGVASADTDIDLYLFDPDGELVASSTNGATDEQIDITDPANGTWTLYVHGWQTVAAEDAYTLYHWVIPGASSGGNLSIDAAPASATLGESGVIDVSWTGASGWSLGAVSHSNDDGVFGYTLVDVDNR